MSLCLPDTFYLRSFGCQMNDHDSERIAGVLAGLGMSRLAEPGGAQLLVFNTCSIREKADTRLLGHLGDARRLKREDPSRLVMVAGCLAQSRREAFLAEHPYIDILVGPQSLHQLPLLIEERLGTGAAQSAFEERTSRFSAELPRARQEGPLAWVQIMTGCTNYCSYCIVPYVRGPEASRAAGEIVEEVRALVDEGVREVTLLGQNVNAYGREPGFSGPAGPADFAGLLERLADVAGLERIRFMTSHPRDVSPRLIRALADLAPVCEHLHLPVQSGSDRILREMRRGYDRTTYLRLVEELKSAVPELALTTDLIVAFPGESEADFADTLSLVSEVGYDAAFTFIYSPRSQTRAAELGGRLPREVAEERMSRLVTLVQEQALRRNRALVGREVEVLVEGESRQVAGQSRGRTRTFKMVNFAGAPAPGSLVRVQIEEATSTSLRGRAVRPAAA
jgi:tRNA-2-methylthio-N6-dimethylallyladenosine synthase